MCDLSCCVISLTLFVGWNIMMCESEPLPSYKHLRNCSYFIFYTRHWYIFHSIPLSVWLGVWSWYHHIMNLLYPSMRSVPVQSFCTSLPATYSVIFTYCLLTYYIIGHIPVVSNAASTEAHSHFPSSPFFSVIPKIRLEILWWNPSRTVIIASICVTWVVVWLSFRYL